MSLQINIVSAPENSALLNQTFTIQNTGASIGRLDSNDICLADDTSISKQHAVIQYQDNHYFLNDVSTNGVFVNDSRVPLNQMSNPRSKLQHQDKIRMGEFVLEAIFTDAKDMGNNVLDIDNLLGSHAGKPLLSEEMTQFHLDGQFSADEIHSDLGATDSIQQASQATGEFDIDAFLSGSTEATISDIDEPAPVNLDTTQHVPTEQYTAPIQPVAPEPNQLADLLIEKLGLTAYKIEDKQQFTDAACSLLLCSVENMRAAMHKREERQRELNADSTWFKLSNNNPLKFSTDASEAIAKMILNDTGGYLKGDEAISECFSDLEDFENNLFDAAGKAVQHQLTKFSPKQVDNILQGGEKRGIFAGKVRDMKAFAKYYHEVIAGSKEALEGSVKELYAKKKLQIEHNKNKA
tara:strand:- start:87607 stop:88830 length:1224 start_codon:yes stop_codon:yes gene_type:complete